MPSSPAQPERAPEPIERFIKQLLVVYKAAKLYPPTSDIPLESAGELIRQLRGLLRDSPELLFQVVKEGLIYHGRPVLPGLAPFERFARECYQRRLAEVRFHSGVSAQDVITFCRVLLEPSDELAVAGGVEQRLWDLQVDGVTVRSVSTKIVDTGLEEAGAPLDADETWPPSHARIDELIDAAYGVRPRDQRLLVRFVQSPRLVSRYLQELASSGRGGRPLTNLVAGKVVSMAHAATSELIEDQPALFRSIAEALIELEPPLRRAVFIERLIPEARIDEAVASVLRQFEVSELCTALVEGISPDPVSADGLSRAIRNLALISLQPKEAILSAAGDAMAEEGLDEDTIATVLDNAAPTQITIADNRNNSARDVESIVKLLDLAPVARSATDTESMALRAEVGNGISDSDVLLSIVTLLTIERRPDMFASLMSIIEDGLGLMLERGEFVEAADAAGMLEVLEHDGSLERAQQTRIDTALRAMAQPRRMRDVMMALRFHHRDTPEADACGRLMRLLGGRTIDPLLEVLADEPDMTARKSLVDLISTLAPGHIGELGIKLNDPRWYVVRNVVSILGATRDRSVLPLLARTLRHNDVRVRRETVRAVAGVRDKLAGEMLTAALSDEDPQNVGLAARYLGTLGIQEAAPQLAAVARGEGRGNRDTGARVEAIEALGRLGTPEAAEALRDVLRQRVFLAGGRMREVRTAAEAALAGLGHTTSAGGA
ncbi:MAG: HEAT repeat domain-containing protein [Coriobacteriia bacterium]|nr:HEAT repeat domain-containing protein [Coriobacteriia bacterium]MBN2839446.1 HEAT repeat domain-containing protein [Coriobacteriia bacterium]